MFYKLLKSHLIKTYLNELGAYIKCQLYYYVIIFQGNSLKSKQQLSLIRTQIIGKIL